MTVNDLTMRAWYTQKIIIKKDDQDFTVVFDGDNQGLRSDLYKELKNTPIRSFGADEDTLVIMIDK